MALHHAEPGEIVDLAPLGAGIKDVGSQAIIKTEQFEAMRLVLHAGEEIPEHRVAGNITLQCLEGRIEIGLGDSSLELVACQWIYLRGGATHSLKGMEDSSLLLTVFFGYETE